MINFNIESIGRCETEKHVPGFKLNKNFNSKTSGITVRYVQLKYYGSQDNMLIKNISTEFSSSPQMCHCRPVAPSTARFHGFFLQTQPYRGLTEAQNWWSFTHTRCLCGAQTRQFQRLIRRGFPYREPTVSSSPPFHWTEEVKCSDL